LPPPSASGSRRSADDAPGRQHELDGDLQDRPALQNAGLACLRINFRSVGESAGEFDGQGGEEHDAAAGLDWLAAKHPGAPRWAAGFSFGSRTVFGLARREPSIEGLALVGFPLRAYELSGVDQLTQPTFMVWGSDDELGALPDLRAQFPTLPANIETAQIEGAGHFFMRFTKELEESVHSWAQRTLASSDQ